MCLSVGGLRGASSNADLSALSLSNATLHPAFTSGNSSYTATVANAITVTAVSATLSDPGATLTSVQVAANGGAPVACPAPGYVCPLAVGSNLITTTVTAADGTVKTYTVTVIRAASSIWV